MCVSGWGTAWAEQTLRFGILAYRSAEQTAEQWAPTVKYLEQQLPGHRVKLHALYFPQLKDAINRQQLDFVLLNPERYVALRAGEHLSAIATLVLSLIHI